MTRARPQADQALAVPAGPVARPSPSGFDPSRWRLRRVFNGTLTRGWQVLHGDQPMSGLFDLHDDAVAAMNEWRTEEAIEKVIAAVMARVTIGNRNADDAPAIRFDVTAAKQSVAVILAGLAEHSPAIREAASTLQDQARLIGECREVIEGLMREFEKFSRYGSPIARSANEPMNAARALLTKLKASVDGATK